MPNRPIWLSPDDIVELNRLVVEGTGVPFFLRDRGLLEGACHRPINLFDYQGVDDIVTLAVALLFGLARNHPFVQGNKRTALRPQ